MWYEFYFGSQLLAHISLRDTIHEIRDTSYLLTMKKEYAIVFLKIMKNYICFK